jgi:hypothetical protein
MRDVDVVAIVDVSTLEESLLESRLAAQTPVTGENSVAKPSNYLKAISTYL